MLFHFLNYLSYNERTLVFTEVWNCPSNINISVNFVDSSGQEFNDFVGPTPANQNGAPNSSTTTKNQNSFFDDFATNTNSSTNSNNSENTTKQTMSKDSIMALFNQRPANVTAQGVNIFLKNRNYSGVITEIFKTFPKFSKKVHSVLYRVFILLQMQTQ